jgi:hypothetical protein
MKFILIETVFKIKILMNTFKEFLNLLVQAEIFEELNKINVISETLNKLKIIINYASTSSINPEETIQAFVKKIYLTNKMESSEETIKSKKIGLSKLKHLKHIWILLNLKRSVLCTINNQV